MRDCRPSSADEDIQLQFSMQLRARADGTIDVRSKAAVSARVPWSSSYQIMPHPRVPETVLPASTQVPALAPSKSWPKFRKKVVPCLKKFYSRSYRHPVHIPPEERQEMLRFLRSGPASPSAPAWIDWSRDMSQSKRRWNSQVMMILMMLMMSTSARRFVLLPLALPRSGVKKFSNHS